MPSLPPLAPATSRNASLVAADDAPMAVESDRVEEGERRPGEGFDAGWRRESEASRASVEEVVGAPAKEQQTHFSEAQDA